MFTASFFYILLCQVHVLDMGYSTVVGSDVPLYRWASPPQEPFPSVPCSTLGDQQDRQFEPFDEARMEIIGTRYYLLINN